MKNHITPTNANNVLAVRACRNCKHSEIQFKTDLYCMNPECDEEFSNDSECDNYMGVVNPNDECKLFEPLATVGSRYIIDKEFRDGGEIELVAIYGKHFCRVKDPDTGAEWDTMLNRLSN